MCDFTEEEYAEYVLWVEAARVRSPSKTGRVTSLATGIARNETLPEPAAVEA